MEKMKKWAGGLLVGSLLMLLVLRYIVMTSSIGFELISSQFTFNASNPLEWIQAEVLPAVQRPENSSELVSLDASVSGLFSQRNFSSEVQNSLQTWNCMKHLANYSQGLPNALEAIREAGAAWANLMASVEKEQQGDTNERSLSRATDKQCPHFLNTMNAAELGDNSYKLRIPCGLVQGSSVTIIGIPNGLLGNFRIDLTGESHAGEPDPSIIFHYNVRFHGDKITEDPVIVQNTWTAAHDWGEEERCPTVAPRINKTGMSYMNSWSISLCYPMASICF